MEFDAYLAARNETQRAFSLRTGIPYRTVHRACKERRAGGIAAVRISEATKSHPTPSGEWVEVHELLRVPQRAA